MTLQTWKELNHVMWSLLYSLQVILWSTGNTGLELRGMGRATSCRDGSHLLRGDWVGEINWEKAGKTETKKLHICRDWKTVEANVLQRAGGEKKNRRQGGEMAQWVKGPVAKSEIWVLPWHLHGERKKLTPRSCPLTYTYTHAHPHMHTHTHTLAQ